jgi:predicted DsbA family dithiol-disulfide isomerase
VRIDIWSDIVCPWCYIGKRRFEKALSAFEHRDQVQVVHRAFQLNPTLPPGHVIDRDEMLMQKYHLTLPQVREMHERLEATAAADGLEYHLDGGVSGNTLDAHRLIHLAGERGLQDAVIERFYRAYFTELQSVFDQASLTTLAVDAGLAEDEVTRVLAGEAYRDAVEADLAQAREYGISGVPFFVFASRYGLSGAQPPAAFEAAFTQAWAG